MQGARTVLLALQGSAGGQAALEQGGLGWWAAFHQLFSADAAWDPAVFVQVAAQENRFAFACFSISDPANLCLSVSIC